VEKSAGGNGSCHCRCVEQLMVRVQALEAGRATAATREPLLPHTGQLPPGIPGTSTHHEAIDITAPMKLTLPLGHLGGERKDAKSIYDDKLTQHADYRYDGGKTGGGWKGKVERYFIAKIPAALNC